MDKEIGKIEPTKLEEYLSVQGWNRERSNPYGCFTIWSNRNESAKFSLLLPLDKEMPGYLSKLGDAVKTIASFENRPTGEIIGVCCE